MNTKFLVLSCKYTTFLITKKKKTNFFYEKIKFFFILRNKCLNYSIFP
jgi:hypothetical protein